MNNRKRFFTDFLLSVPSFLSGASTVINLSGNYYKYNTSSSDFDADMRAISNDFGVVGDDIREAIENIRKDQVACN